MVGEGGVRQVERERGGVVEGWRRRCEASEASLMRGK
jgi:hypothetical protein